MGNMNRAQRRKAMREGLLKQDAGESGMSLADWLSEPKAIARRGEVWEVIQIAMYLREREKVHNRWYNRALRAIRRFFHRHFSVGIAGPPPSDEFPTPEPGMEAEPPAEDEDD